jgi:Skp family chaperone for outer membrane proteins
MKTKTMILSGLVGVVVLCVGYEASLAKAKAGDTGELKIGVVSVQRIIRDCKRSAKYREETTAERDKIAAELERLQAEIEADRATLRTRKAGSSDYLALVKEILVKQGNLQAQQKFYEQQVGFKEQKMIEGLYKDILQAVGEVAGQRGLDLVFEKSEPELPAAGATELMRIIDTNKLLYSRGVLDISEEVMARLDAGK